MTTNRIRSVKGLFKYATQAREVTAKGIVISTVVRLQLGGLSNRFLMARLADKEVGVDVDLEESSNSVSIIYRIPPESRGPHRFDTLDLVIPNDDDFNAFVTTLKDLMERHEAERQHYDQDILFLRFHWTEMKKEFTDRLSASEWTVLCDRMNVPVKKTHLATHYREFIGDLQSEEGLTFIETAELLDEVREIALAMEDMNLDDDPCVRLWNQILESDPVPAPKIEHESGDDGHEMMVTEEEDSISAVAFLSFVRSEQKEYTTSLKQVHDCLRILNSMISSDADGETDLDRYVEESSAERVTRSRFVAYLMSDSNDLMNPQMGKPGYEDMTSPLSHYWINTSHDTYLARFSDGFGTRRKVENAPQTLSVDLQMYTEALLRGVRALEIDTWDGISGGPVVARCKPEASSEFTIMFSDVLRAVRSFLASNPKSLPVILCIENHCSLSNQEKMAHQLKEILGTSGMLYEPEDSVALSDKLPSPGSLRGKVVIKGKRPKVIKEGATVINDDFDDDIDIADDDSLLQDILEEDDQDEEDEENGGVIIGFEASGPVRSDSPDAVQKSPMKLLAMASDAAEEARMEAFRAKTRTEELRRDAEAAEELAAARASEAGLSMSELKSRALGDADDEGTEIDLTTFKRRMIQQGAGTGAETTKSVAASDSAPDEGVEVQDFFEGSVEEARLSFAAADAELLQAADTAATKAIRLDEAEEALRQAQLRLAASYEKEKELIEAAKRAAAEARSNREHAETARYRVDTVREMLRNWKDHATSAETVVHTAMTEAKISDQRAVETEVRYNRALTTAEKDRARADLETQKEESLEQEANALHEKTLEATNVARAARDRMEKAATSLDKVNEQIKLIEKSTQYQKEVSEASNNGDDMSERSPQRVSRFVAKHTAKLKQREECTQAIIVASTESAEVEEKRRRAQEAFEEKARAWKVQAEIASKARKQADRSLTIAEELAEHAEEEREAAALRKDAHDRASKNVHQSDSYRSSVQAQLLEAERASAEAASMAVESRKRAEQLEKDAASATDHSVAFSTLESRKLQREEAFRQYEAAMEKKKQAEANVANAKRLLETSSEVLSNAKREAAAEIHRANAELQAERSAIAAYNKAVLLRKQATHALSLAKLAEAASAEKNAAFAHAREYKERQDKVGRISVALASMTLLDSLKFKYWEKSQTLLCTQMHSFSQGLVLQMLDLDAQVSGLLKFSRSHMCRTFPSWKVTDRKTRNYNPVAQWAVGCQLVSMNFHSSDEHLLVNDGKFRMNGSSGYVLKPSYLLKDGHPSERWQHWKFEILSGRCLPKPESAGRRGISVGLSSTSHVSPYVRVSLYDGVSGKDSSKVLYTTKPSHRNGINPVWHRDKDFDVAIERPSIAVLLFTVWDKRADGSSDFIAGAAVPASCIREGYRTVSLFDSLHTKCGPYSFASLFIRAQKLS